MIVNREDWLQQAAVWLDANIIQPCGASLPKVIKVAPGFPKNRRAIGECWPPQAAADGESHHIFIHPKLSDDDTLNLLQVLLHECIHAAVGNDQKHAGEFKRVAREIGLEGRLTRTFVSPGTELGKTLQQLADTLGPYPHSPLDQVQENTEKKEKSTAGPVTLHSPSDPEFKITMTRKRLETFGAPLDTHGEPMVQSQD